MQKKKKKSKKGLLKIDCVREDWYLSNNFLNNCNNRGLKLSGMNCWTAMGSGEGWSGMCVCVWIIIVNYTLNT